MSNARDKYTDEEVKVGIGIEGLLKQNPPPKYKKLTKEEMWEVWEEIQKSQEEEYKKRYGKSKK